MNNHQRERFAKNIVKTLYNTISGKNIAFLGWAFKKDTNDTRESAAIYVADHLLEDGANIHIYDPKVSESKIKSDLLYLWELKGISESRISQKLAQIFVHKDYNEALNNSHAIAVLTEWDEFTTYDWTSIYENMFKPAFIFDGRNILDANALNKIGFQFKGIGKG